jgi:hypothetical protein
VKAQKPQDIDMPFPLNGIEETTAYSRQRQGTSADEQNVRAFDPGTDRARGGMRSGMSKWMTTRVNGAASIQNINRLVTAIPLQATATTYDGFAYAQASGSGFGIGNTASGASLFSGLGAVSGYAFACSCWDDENNLYVAELKQTTGDVNLYCISQAGAVTWTQTLSLATPAAIWTGSITAATNATPIAITIPNHGLQTNWKVTITGVLGNTAANGTFVITRTGANTFTLNTSVGNGAYTSGGTATLVANITGATNATPVSILSVAHSLSSGQTVTVTGALGNTGANGTYVVTVTDADNFTMATAAGNGAYTQSSGLWQQTGRINGMVVIGDRLFIAVTMTSGVSDTVNGQCRIHSIVKGTGAIEALDYVRSTIANVGPYFSRLAHNCLGKIGTVLGVDSSGSVGAASSKHGFWQYETSKAAGSAAISFTQYANTRTANQTRVCSDGISQWYVISSTATSKVAQIGLNGIIGWASTVMDADGVNAMCYDPVGVRLVACAGANNAIRTLATTTGLLGTSVAVNATQYNEIGTDGTGKFVLWRNSVGSNDVVCLSSGLTATATVTLANAVHSGASVNSGQRDPSLLFGSRVNIDLAVAGGKLVTFTTSGPATVSGGQSFNAAASVVFSTQAGLNMFYVDGVGYYYYKSSTGAVATWLATSGTVPYDSPIKTAARLICNYRGRIVLAGYINNPQAFYMSAQFNPFDWQYSPNPTTTTRAVNGTATLAGFTGDMINCLMPFNDDTMIFGCDHSLWRLSGDLADGGSFDCVSQLLGTPWGRPFALDPNNLLYFMGSDCLIYKMAPGSLQDHISQEIRRRLQNINLSTSLVSMAWDQVNQGLAVWITPFNPATETVNYFWEERTRAWHPDFYGLPALNPMAVYARDGDAPEDRVIFLGGRDGYLRYLDPTASTDDGTPIDSFVVVGPLMTKDLDSVKLKSLVATLSETSGDVTYSIHVGDSPEAALVSAAVDTGTWGAGRTSVSFIQRDGRAIYIKISSTNRWAMEKITARFVEVSGRRF